MNKKIEVLSISTSHVETFGNRVGEAIETSGLSKAWVAEKLGISKQALHYIIKYSLKPKLVDEISEILKINPEWLESSIGPKKTESSPAESNTIPILKSDQVYAWVQCKDKFDENEKVIINFPEKGYLAYKLQNDALFPPFIEGSILIFKLGTEANHGDYVLIIDNANQAFVRCVSIDADSIYYNSINSTYKSFQEHEATVLGILNEARYQIN